MQDFIADKTLKYFSTLRSLGSFGTLGTLRNLGTLGSFIFMLLLLLLSGLQAQQDPFKRSKDANQIIEEHEQNEEQAQYNNVATAKTAKQQNQWHDWRNKLRKLLAMPPWLVEWQRTLQAQVSSYARKIKQSSWQESWYLYTFAFILAMAFGFLHVIGPGHGKIFTISYLTVFKATWVQGLWLSVIINIVDSLSAGMIVFLTYSLLQLSSIEGQWLQSIVAVSSYGLIVLWCLWHLCSMLLGKHHHHCKHTENHQHNGKNPAKKTAKNPWYFALGVGLLPCPISTALLIFGLLNDMLAIAIFLVAGVSMGGMVAMAMLSTAIIGGKQGFYNLLFLKNGTSALKIGNISMDTLGEAMVLLLMISFGIMFILLSYPT